MDIGPDRLRRFLIAQGSSIETYRISKSDVSSTRYPPTTRHAYLSAPRHLNTRWWYSVMASVAPDLHIGVQCPLTSITQHLNTAQRILWEPSFRRLCRRRSRTPRQNRAYRLCQGRGKTLHQTRTSDMGRRVPSLGRDALPCRSIGDETW